MKPYSSHWVSNPSHLIWDLNPVKTQTGTRTHCFLTEIALLVSGLKEQEFCFVLESLLETRLFLKRLLPGLFLKSNYTVYEHCIYSYFTVFLINDLQKKPYDQDQKMCFPFSPDLFQVLLKR